ncbi:MAG: DUF350 domain-containing protein [Balneolaceae bacterium]
MNIEQRNKILTLVLGLVIIGLSYWLYDSLVTPYKVVEERRAETEQVRNRMLDVKDALIQYETRNDEFPPTNGGLDSLVNFLKSDSMMVAKGDTLFGRTFDVFNPDSLVFSPRPPHNKFEYALNDTLRPNIYLLEDPDTDDAVGSLERTTMRNAPNWN